VKTHYLPLHFPLNSVSVVGFQKVKRKCASR